MKKIKVFYPNPYHGFNFVAGTLKNGSVDIETPGLFVQYIVSEGEVVDEDLWAKFVSSGLGKLAYESAIEHERKSSSQVNSTLTLHTAFQKRDGCIIPSLVCLSTYTPTRKRKGKDSLSTHTDESKATSVLVTVEQHSSDSYLLEICDEQCDKVLDFDKQLCVFSKNVAHRVKQPMHGIRKSVVIFY